MRCPDCNADFPDSPKYCPACGSDLSGTSRLGATWPPLIQSVGKPSTYSSDPAPQIRLQPPAQSDYANLPCTDTQAIHIRKLIAVLVGLVIMATTIGIVLSLTESKRQDRHDSYQMESFHAKPSPNIQPIPGSPYALSLDPGENYIVAPFLDNGPGAGGNSLRTFVVSGDGSLRIFYPEHGNDPGDISTWDTLPGQDSKSEPRNISDLRVDRERSHNLTISFSLTDSRGHQCRASGMVEVAIYEIGVVRYSPDPEPDRFYFASRNIPDTDFSALIDDNGPMVSMNLRYFFPRITPSDFAFSPHSGSRCKVRVRFTSEPNISLQSETEFTYY